MGKPVKPRQTIDWRRRGCGRGNRTTEPLPGIRIQSDSFMELLARLPPPRSLFTLHLAIIFYHASFVGLSLPFLGQGGGLLATLGVPINSWSQIAYISVDIFIAIIVRCLAAVIYRLMAFNYGLRLPHFCRGNKYKKRQRQPRKVMSKQSEASICFGISRVRNVFCGCVIFVYQQQLTAFSACLPSIAHFRVPFSQNTNSNFPSAL